ncbi:hypothetical protein E9993_17015 [Labilibacter sediminis]|nr:hypothetical protein E9993_17015 [Labilibacter sediminis]
MKNLIWKLVLPMTIISIVTLTKWWYVLPVDAPETLMKGFPLPFVCPGWHTSLSLQIFITDFLIDIFVFFMFWFVVVFCIDRFLTKIIIHKIMTVMLLTITGLITAGTIIVATNQDNIFYTIKPWRMDVLETGYKFIWQSPQVSPNFNLNDKSEK